MKILYSNEQSSVNFTHEIAEAVERVMNTVVKLTNIDFSISILLTDAVGIADLNRDFREVNKPTDVLSFPTYELTAPMKSEDDIPDAEWEEGLLFLGDIAISLERAQAQAEEYGHSMEREVSFLALHGVLHLMGYDHMNTMDEKSMLDMQRKVMEEAGISR